MRELLSVALVCRSVEYDFLAMCAKEKDTTSAGGRSFFVVSMVTVKDIYFSRGNCLLMYVCACVRACMRVCARACV